MKFLFVVLVFSMLFTACSTSSSYRSSYKSYSNYSIVSKLNSVKRQWSRTPYVLGGTKVNGSDCSGFTQTVFSSFGVKLPRTTRAQMSSGRSVSRSSLRAGDLLFFRTGRGPNGLHVGIYTSNGKFIHLSTRGGVKEVQLNTKYWTTKYIGARRYLR